MKRSIAMIAVLFLLLRPFCDASAASHDAVETAFAAQSSAWQDSHGANPHDGVPCSASLADSVFSKPGEAGALRIDTHAQAAIMPFAWIPAGYGGVSMPAIRNSASVPPPSPSYYVRSARIQR